MYTTTVTPTPRRAPGQRPTPDQVRLNQWLFWQPEGPREPQVLSIAELAECRCPDLCDRDHANE